MKEAYSRNKELPLFFGEVQMTGEKQNIDVSICILPKKVHVSVLDLRLWMTLVKSSFE